MTRCTLSVVTSLALLASCSREAPPMSAATSSSTPTRTESSAVDALDRIDTRVPVPLLPMMAAHQKRNMRDHLAAVQEIVAALAADDFLAIERALGRIGFSAQMGATCTHMGSGAPGFAEQSVHFHHTADRITSAARARDRARVLTELSATLQTCTSCHAAWKQQVVDEPTWLQLTSSAARADGPPRWARRASPSM